MINIYEGTEFGNISNYADTLIGRIIMKNSNCGVIQFVGNLPGSKEVWAGIDWMDPDVGKHDGTFKGISYFKATSPTSGSFIKLNTLNLGCSLEEAIVYHYCICDECQLRDASNPVTLIKTKSNNNSTANTPLTKQKEFKIEFYSDLDDTKFQDHDLCSYKRIPVLLPTLKSIILNNLPVFDCFTTSNTSDIYNCDYCGPISEYTLGIEHLDLNSTLISDFCSLSNICKQFPSTKILNISKCRIRLLSPQKENLIRYCFTPQISQEIYKPFASITQLIAVDLKGLFSYEYLMTILENFHSLKELCIAKNHVGDLPKDFSIDKFARYLVNLESLDIAENDLTDFDLFCNLLDAGNSSLKQLNLNGNKFANIQCRSITGRILPSLRFIHLLYNPIADLESTFNTICKISSLAEILFPFNDFVTKLCFENLRQEVVARLPKLKINHQITSDEEQRGAEIDFIKKHFEEYKSLNLSPDQEIDLDHDHYSFISTYQRIVKVYGMPTEEECRVLSTKIKDNLINLTLQRIGSSGDVEKSITKSFPYHMDVSKLYLVCRKLFKLPKAKFVIRKPYPVEGSEHLCYDNLDNFQKTLSDYSLLDADVLEIVC